MRISVLIPCYNAAPFLAAALDSVLQQDWDDLEVIVVNDGSTDGSDKVLAEYAGKRVKVLEQANAGQCAAANRAFRECTGDLIKFFDADDIMRPSMLSRQAARLGQRVNAIAMGEWARFVQDPAEADFQPLSAYRDAHPVDWLATEWTNALPMMQCALWLIPRQILNKSGLWDERLSLINDFEFFTRVLLTAEEILYTPGARLYYRSAVPGSLSGQKTRKAIESQFLSLMLGIAHLVAEDNSPRTRRACANVLQAFDYEHFPRHPDLRRVARSKAIELGGANIRPNGPPGFHTLRPFIGWKAARRVQHFAEGLRINRASLRTAKIRSAYPLSSNFKQTDR